ncbi:MAG: DUF1080 domain-containing protein [Bacteroidota bacterium]
MNTLLLRSLILIAVVLLSCNSTTKAPTDQIEEVPQTEWTSLFDGSSLDSWKGWKQDKPSAKWQVVDGEIVFDPAIEGPGGDLISKEEYENFEFSLEWKISDCGNSGIFWNVVESDEYAYPWLTGPEMQVLDNACHPDAKIDTHRAGDLYDMIEATPANFRGANEWNEVTIKSENGKMEFWQNGTQVVTFTMHTPEWDAMVADSKFNTMPAFGKATKGKLGLQDHGDKVHFRNLKIKVL